MTSLTNVKTPQMALGLGLEVDKALMNRMLLILVLPIKNQIQEACCAAFPPGTEARKKAGSLPEKELSKHRVKQRRKAAAHTGGGGTQLHVVSRQSGGLLWTKQ